MGNEREFDALASEAIAASEREIFDKALGHTSAEPDDTGDQSLEEMGDGLEGQLTDDETGEGEGDGAEPKAETHEGKPEGEEGDGKAGQDRDGQGRFKPQGEGQQGKTETAAERGLRSDLVGEREKRQAAEKRAEDADRRLAAIEASLRQMQQQPPQQRQEPEPAEQQPVDFWTDPQGFFQQREQQMLAAVEQRELARENARMRGSFQDGHAEHGDAFLQAYNAIDRFTEQHPQHGPALMEHIRTSPNPGRAVMQWHQRAQAAAEIGNDPVAFRERERASLRDSLMKDPEFRKQAFAEWQAEARGNGDGGPARTATRLPPSLNTAQGAGASRVSTGDAMSDAELFEKVMR